MKRVLTFFLNEPCFEAVIVIEAGIVNKQLFAEVEVNSGIIYRVASAR